MWRNSLGVIDNSCSLNGRHFLESYPVTIRNVHPSKKLKTFGLGVTLWIPIMINWRATCNGNECSGCSGLYHQSIKTRRW
ncbi:hypothetical protein VNO80_04847 [Phaseolus coccineus]|uniref:Uncharacterized protein n=1 Tax=Phaseolus coccineus TaxID=3886 RepID=A0AAN9P1I8_PHACN